jgi:hypothetical protein
MLPIELVCAVAATLFCFKRILSLCAYASLAVIAIVGPSHCRLVEGSIRSSYILQLPSLTYFFLYSMLTLLNEDQHDR